MIKALWFVRHGQSEANARGVYGGSTNVALTAAGRDQAQAAAALLQTAGLTAVIASPLDRARQTAEIIVAELGLDPAIIQLDADLCEINSGSLTGTPDLGFTQFIAHLRAGTDPTADTIEAVATRVGRVLGRLSDDPRLDGQTVLLAAHAGVGRILRSLLEGVALESLATVTIPNASPMELPLDRLIHGAIR